jgi:hypothetical protein
MNKKRIQIYADDETIRRVEVAAQKHNLPVSTYCLAAVQLQLEEDGIEASEQVDESDPAQFQELIAEIRDLQERILRERAGQPVDVDSLLEELREERDEETLGLR